MFIPQKIFIGLLEKMEDYWSLCFTRKFQCFYFKILSNSMCCCFFHCKTILL